MTPHIGHPEQPAAAGKRVLLAYTAVPMDVVVQAMETMKAAGAHVELMGPQIRGYERAYFASSGHTRLIRRLAPVAVDPDNRPRKYTPRWAKIVATNVSRKALNKPVQKAFGAPTAWWLAASQNPAALREIQEADVICAVDSGAVYLCWQAARRNSRAAVINGIGPTLDHLGLGR